MQAQTDSRLVFYLCINKYLIKSYYLSIRTREDLTSLKNITYWAKIYSANSYRVINTFETVFCGKNCTKENSLLLASFKYFFIYQATGRLTSKKMCMDWFNIQTNTSYTYKKKFLQWFQEELKLEPLKNSVFE